MVKALVSTVIYIFEFPQEREHDSEDEDEDKYADDIDMPGQNFDSKRRITVRNLRIREDTAKVRHTSEDTFLFLCAKLHVNAWLSNCDEAYFSALEYSWLL